MVTAIGSAFSAAVGGLNNAGQRILNATNNIANQSVEPAAKSSDLARDIVDLSIASLDYKANAAVIRTVTKTEQELLRVLDTQA